MIYDMCYEHPTKPSHSEKFQVQKDAIFVSQLFSATFLLKQMLSKGILTTTGPNVHKQLIHSSISLKQLIFSLTSSFKVT